MKTYVVIEDKYVMDSSTINFNDPYYQNKPITYGFIDPEAAQKYVDEKKNQMLLPGT